MVENAENLKVVLVGESGVGKTSIIAQFTSNTFDPDCVTSLSAQYISKTMEFPNVQKAIKFDIWDTAGQEKYRAIAKIFYKDAKVIVLCYDITDQKSFDAIKNYWHNTIKTTGDPDAILALVANKNDLYNKAAIKDEEGAEYARSIGAIFQSTSAKSDTGITTLFENIGQKFFNPNYDIGAEDKKTQEEYERKKMEEKKKKKEIKGVQLKSETQQGKKKKKCC